MTLGGLARTLEQQMTPAQKQAAHDRSRQIQEQKEKKIAAQKQADQAVFNQVPLHAAQFMEALAKVLPKDAVIFDEALTSSPELTRYIIPSTHEHFFQTRGGSLGVGIPGALAAKLANPEKTVLGFTGDGGSMYTIQALWTAAHHHIGAKIIICNNHSYMLLELNILQYWKEQAVPEHTFPNPFLLSNPAIDFVKMAQSMGVEAVRVENPADIAPAIEKMLSDDKPFLIDLVITDHLPGTK